MLVSFLVFGQIFTFLVAEYLVLFFIFFSLFISVLSLLSSIYVLIKLRVSIYLWFMKELFELISYSVAFIKTYQSDLHHRLWRPHILGSLFSISNMSKSSIQAEYESGSLS